jgi:hypothetical protein
MVVLAFVVYGSLGFRPVRRRRPGAAAADELRNFG